MVLFVWCMETRWPLVMKGFLAIILCLMSDVHGRGAVQSRIARMTFDLTSCASQPLRPGMYLPRATVILAIPFRLPTHCYSEKAPLDSNTPRLQSMSSSTKPRGCACSLGSRCEYPARHFGGPLSDPNFRTRLLSCRSASSNSAMACLASDGILFRHWLHVQHIVRLHLAA
jgi:hypothetical protein